MSHLMIPSCSPNAAANYDDLKSGKEERLEIITFTPARHFLSITNLCKTFGMHSNGTLM